MREYAQSHAIHLTIYSRSLETERIALAPRLDLIRKRNRTSNRLMAQTRRILGDNFPVMNEPFNNGLDNALHSLYVYASGASVQTTVPGGPGEYSAGVASLPTGTNAIVVAEPILLSDSTASAVASEFAGLIVADTST